MRYIPFWVWVWWQCMNFHAIALTYNAFAQKLIIQQNEDKIKSTISISIYFFNNIAFQIVSFFLNNYASFFLLETVIWHSVWSWSKDSQCITSRYPSGLLKYSFSSLLYHLSPHIQNVIDKIFYWGILFDYVFIYFHI